MVSDVICVALMFFGGAEPGVLRVSRQISRYIGEERRTTANTIEGKEDCTPKQHGLFGLYLFMWLV